jgi:hypothetical protein
VGIVVAVAMPALGRCPEPARAQPADVRVLTLRVVAEEMYRARPGWEAEPRRTVQTVSGIYERAFQIRFVIQDVVPWTIGAILSNTTAEAVLSHEVAHLFGAFHPGPARSCATAPPIASTARTSGSSV